MQDGKGAFLAKVKVGMQDSGLFSQGGGCKIMYHLARAGEEVSDEKVLWNLLNKPSHVQGVSTSCQMQLFSTPQGT